MCVVSVLDLCVCFSISCLFFFFKQKTAYEMRISDWSSDVCSSDLGRRRLRAGRDGHRPGLRGTEAARAQRLEGRRHRPVGAERGQIGRASCRESVCQYVSISVVAGSLKKTYNTRKNSEINKK